MWELPWRRRGRGKRADREGTGRARWLLCLLCMLSPALSFPPKANPDKPLQGAALGDCRDSKGAARGHQQGSAPIPPPPPLRKAPQALTIPSMAREWHLGARHPWLTSPFLSQLHQWSPMYWWPLLAAALFPCAFYFLLIQGRESSASGAAFRGVVRSVLFWDGAVVQELTFCVFTSDLPRAVIISHATRNIGWNDSRPVASAIAT